MVVASALLVANAAPGGAVAIPPENGAGVATGGFTTLGSGDVAPPLGLLCDPVDKANTPDQTSSAVLEIWSAGTFTATDLGNLPPGGIPRATYTGPAHAVFKTSQTYYINPLGTFVDPSCTIPAVPLVNGIPGTLVVDQVTNNPLYAGGTVHCEGPAQYGRDAAELGLVVALSATCTVKDTLLPVGPYTSTGVTITYEAAEQPCTPVAGLPCVLVPVGTDFAAGTEWAGTYTET